MSELISKVKIFFQKDIKNPELEEKGFEEEKATEKEEIISDLKSAKDELDTAISNFSFATDPRLIEVYSYQIKAAQVKYNYHLSRAKRCN